GSQSESRRTMSVSSLRTPPVVAALVLLLTSTLVRADWQRVYPTGADLPGGVLWVDGPELFVLTDRVFHSRNGGASWLPSIVLPSSPKIVSKALSLWGHGSEILATGYAGQ